MKDEGEVQDEDEVEDKGCEQGDMVDALKCYSPKSNPGLMTQNDPK